MYNILYMDKKVKKKVGKFYKKYVPKSLTKNDKEKQIKSILKEKQRPKLKSFKEKKSTWTEKFHKKYGKKSLEWIYKNIIKKKQAQAILSKGKAAYYSSGSRPNQTPQSWARARLYSVIMGGPSRKIDKKLWNEGKLI